MVSTTSSPRGARREGGVITEPLSATKLGANQDRYQHERKVFGVMPFAVKVAASDSGGQALVVEQANAYRGGPPRHVHHAQEEWFYVVEGEYVVEVGGVRHTLLPTESLLASRGVAHTWALTGASSGRLLIAFFPPGQMEAFFDAATQLAGMPPHAALCELFARHGMEVTGPPLTTGEE